MNVITIEQFIFVLENPQAVLSMKASMDEVNVPLGENIALNFTFDSGSSKSEVLFQKEGYF